MNRRSSSIAIALAMVLITSQGSYAAVKTPLIIKKAGRAISLTPNTILSGSGAPAKTVGINGDFYIDIKNAILFGPKVKGLWKIATSLRAIESKDISISTSGTNGTRGDRGEQGLTGADGAVGSKGPTGDRGLTGAAGVAGAAGSMGLSGATGINGAPGTAGVKGDMGPTGSAGVSGSTGATGSNGATGPAGATGINGAPGPAGATGPAGAAGVKGDAGLTGSAGPAGSTGAAGISNGKSSSITFTGNLAGAAGSIKASDSFGTFVAGKSYVVRILINTYDANALVFTYGLGLSLSASGDNPVIKSNYSVIYGSIYSGGNRSTVSIIADVELNGASTTNTYSLIATLTSGANGQASIVGSGTSTQIQVGSIG